MAARITCRIGIDSDETEHINLDAGLLERLATASLLDRLADLDETSGQRIGAGVRRMATANEQHAAS